MNPMAMHHLAELADLDAVIPSFSPYGIFYFQMTDQFSHETLIQRSASSSWQTLWMRCPVWSVFSASFPTLIVGFAFETDAKMPRRAPYPRTTTAVVTLVRGQQGEAVEVPADL